MTAQLIEFPQERVRACWNPPEAPCLILILPVVRIEHDDGLGAKRRQAWMDAKRRLCVGEPWVRAATDAYKHVSVVDVDAATGLSFAPMYMGMDLGRELD